MTQRFSPDSHAATCPSWSRTMTSLKSYVPGDRVTSEVHLSASPHVIPASPHSSSLCHPVLMADASGANFQPLTRMPASVFVYRKSAGASLDTSALATIEQRHQREVESCRSGPMRPVHVHFHMACSACQQHGAWSRACVWASELQGLTRG